MKRKPSVVIPALLLSLLLLTIQHTFGQTIPRKFYKYDVVATANVNLNVFAAPSINDYGAVAFSARNTNGGGTVFLNEIGQSNVDLMPGLSGNSTQFVSGRVQINNLKQVIQQTFISGTTPAQNVLRRINGVNDFTLIAYANGAGGFNDFSAIQPASISINNLGEPAFVTAQGSNTTILTTGIRPDFSLQQFPSTGDSLRPMISDGGCVVVRAGATATDPLRIYDSENLSNFETIASASDGFTAIGRSPAISDYCEVIVFYGELNQAGAQALGTNSGPGIFASIELDKKQKQRKIVRLAGRLIENNSASGGNDDGYCDVGETCMPGELGFTQNKSPIFFSSFDTLERVAVAHQSIGADGIEDDIFVVSFLGTPNVTSDNPTRPFSDQYGLWTLTTQIKNESGVLREKPLAAVPVVQIGDIINSRTVTNINVYDQIANVRIPNSTSDSPGDHRLAFHVTTNNGNMIVRAERNVETPVIFIPGILGSTLTEKSQNGSTIRELWLGNPLFILSNFERLADLQSTSTKIVGTDAIRRYTNLPLTGNIDRNIIYKSLLEDSLMMQGGLREYKVDGKDERRTFDGCDMNQRFDNPTLFVFAYDWRKSNIENAGKLKQYVECIQRFYPSTKVDIVAHSMGGLLARRYITQFPTSNSVQKLITIASPFLGAPAALQTIETGRLHFLPEIVNQYLPAFAANPIKTLTINSPAAHELLPSEAYFTLGGSPFVEETFDINNDGIASQIYDYPQLFSFYNARFLSVYSTNESFHSYRGQDDWRSDTSGVQYFHIIGRRSIRDTIEGVIATPVMKRPLFDARRELRLRNRKGIGDQTVPNRSAEKCENEGCESGLDFNEPTASVIKFIGENNAEDKLYSHIGLVKSSEVRTEVLNILELPFQSLVSENQNGGESMRVVTRDRNGPTGAILPPLKQAYYLSVSGIGRINITDDEGNTNTPVGNAGFEIGVPGVSYSGGTYDGNGTYQELTMPAEEGSYTFKFITGTDSIDIELTRGVGNVSPNLSIRYLDLVLPANVECLLTINAQGMEDLRYDSNGDGTFDTIVPAHVRVSGTAAQDVTAPDVTITQDGFSKGRPITVSAADSQSGVKTIYYRIIGESTNFQIYTAPFTLPRGTIKRVVEAFADDNVGNRSSPVQTSVLGPN